MNKFKASFYNFIFGSFANGFNIIIGIVMVPYYLNFFSISTYGAWLASGSIIAMVGSLESGLSFIITQKLASDFGNKNFKKFRLNSGSGFAFILLVSIIFLSIALFLVKYIPSLVNCPENEIYNLTNALYIVSISVLFALINSFLGVFTQVWQKTLIPNLSRNIGAIISVVFIIILLQKGFGLSSIAFGYLSREIIVFVINFIYTTNLWKKKKINNIILDFNHFKNLFKELLIPFIGRIAQTILSRAHIFLIAMFISPNLSAIYDFTSKVSLTIKGFITIYSNGVFGSISLAKAEKNKSEYDILNQKIVFFLLLLIIFGFGFSFIFSYDIVKIWVGESNYFGDIMVLLIIIYCITGEFLNFQNNILIVEKEYNFATYIMVSYSILFLIISTLLIQFTDLNLYSIPVSFIISSIFAIICSGFIITKKYKIRLIQISKNSLNFLFSSFIVILIFKFLLINKNNLIYINALYALIYIFTVLSLFYLFNKPLFIETLNRFKIR
ncbi:MAG: hypothetical protein CMC04_07690 [Flavobacteriaceae bacterium]|nr:hypothetical protein [Flavobacteriaceae bacterium]|tara:strand:+ start:17137 stop:18633 length:1497 start_codon:yes stop_codon:yes gene_type:complete